jgi:hypothetical protein
LYRSLNIIKLEKYSKQKSSITLIHHCGLRGILHWKPLLRKDFGKGTGDATNVHVIGHVLNSVDMESGTLSYTPGATHLTSPSTLTSFASCGQGLTMLTSQSSSLRTRNVGNKGLDFIVLARHGQNGLLCRRSSVGGTPCEPKVKIRQQKEPLTEEMRKMYSWEVDVEVEDKSCHLEPSCRTARTFSR